MAVKAIAVISVVHNNDSQTMLRAEVYGTVLGRNDFQCVIDNIDAEGNIAQIRANVEDGVKTYLTGELGIIFLPSDTVKCL